MFILLSNNGLLVNDNILQVVIVLFILSLINERVANIFKLSLHNKTIKLLSFNLNTLWGIASKEFHFNNLSEKSLFKTEEKKREYKLLLINILLGWAVAAIVNFDIFLIFKKSEDNKDYLSSFGWNNIQIDFNYYHIVNFILGFLAGYIVFIIFKTINRQNQFLQSVENDNGAKNLTSSMLGTFFIAVLAIVSMILDSNTETHPIVGFIFIGFTSFIFVFTSIVVITNYSNNKSGNGIFTFLYILLAYTLFSDLVSEHLIYPGSYNSLIVTKKTFSFLFAGAFLSMGSKFWHDILDLIFQIKNYNQKLKDPNTYNQPTLASLDEYLSIPQYNIVLEVYNTYKKSLLEKEGVTEVYIDIVDSYNKTYGIVVCILPNHSPAIESTVYYEFTSGTRYPIQIKKIESKSQIELNLRAIISNSDKIIGRASLSAGVLVFKNDNAHVITCAHGLLNDEFYKRDNKSDQLVNHPLGKQTIEIIDEPGSPSYGPFEFDVSFHVNRFMDVTLIKLEENDKFKMEKFKTLGGYQYEFSNVIPGDKVYVKNHDSNSADGEGYIAFNKDTLAVKINSGTFSGVCIYDLIKIFSTEKISIPGMSGSLVIDSEKKPVGIILGSNAIKNETINKYETYVLSLEKICNTLNLTLTKNLPS